MHFIIKAKRIYLVVIFLLTSLLPTQQAFADEVYVYCAADKEHWHWLDNKNVKVSGQWKYRKINYIIYQRYFKIDGGIYAVIDLQNQCKSEFGQEYKYAQPADNDYTGWQLFGVENGFIVKGINENLKFLPRI